MNRDSSPLNKELEKALTALMRLVYKDNSGRWRAGILCDSDVTDIVGPILDKQFEVIEPPQVDEEARFWREAFTNERAMRYMDVGMKVEAARICAETDAHAVRADLAAAAQEGK